MIIDVHTHYTYPLSEKTGQDFIRECDKNGVNIIFISNLGNWEAYPDSEAIRKYNDDAADFAERYPERIRWLAYINPQNTDAIAEIERCCRKGAAGLKLWISLKDENGCSGKTEEVFKKAAELSLPCLTHCYHRTKVNLPGELNLTEIAEFALKIPEVTIIAAHVNANWPITKGIMRSTGKNLLVDISGCYPEAGIVEDIVVEIGTDRILFGSDFTGRSLPSQIAKIKLAKLNDDDREKILWRNCARLFKIKETELKEISEVTEECNTFSDIDCKTDYSVFCGHWAINPGRSITAEELGASLQQNGINTAFTASLDAVFGFDLHCANTKFLKSVTGIQTIKPLITVNPCAYNWKDVIDSTEKEYAGFMLHPYLHNWDISDKSLDCFFSYLGNRTKPVFINLEFGDHRFQHFGLAPRQVSLEELTTFAEKYNELECIFQGAKFPMIDDFLTKFDSSNFKFEISRLTDTTMSLRKIAEKHGTEHLVMGAEFPLREINETRFTLPYL